LDSALQKAEQEEHRAKTAEELAQKKHFLVQKLGEIEARKQRAAQLELEAAE
jgi:hypothetical protein